MRLHPDACVAEGVLGVRVGLVAVLPPHVTELLDGLVDGHVVRQHVVADQELQLVPRRTLLDVHSRLQQ